MRLILFRSRVDQWWCARGIAPDLARNETPGVSCSSLSGRTLPGLYQRLKTGEKNEQAVAGAWNFFKREGMSGERVRSVPSFDCRPEITCTFVQPCVGPTARRRPGSGAVGRVNTHGGGLKSIVVRRPCRRPPSAPAAAQSR